MKGEKTVRKNLDLTSNCVKLLSKKAIDSNTVFKLYAQDILEKAAKKIDISKKK